VPSKSFSQARMMAAAAHDPVFAKRAKVPTKVAKEYNMADKRSGFLKSAMRAKGPAYAEGGKVEDEDKVDALTRRMREDSESRKKPSPSAVPMKPRSDKRNPDRATITPRVYDKPPQYAKGGSVKGKGCESKGARPAKYY
jgi:hypothetical protein